MEWGHGPCVLSFSRASMRYTRSLLLGSFLVLVIIILSVLTYYYSLGACPIGSFSCDNGTYCVQQKHFCDSKFNCKDGMDESPEQCGNTFGSVKMVNNNLRDRYIKNDTNRIECHIPDQSVLPENCECVIFAYVRCYDMIKVPHVPHYVNGLYFSENNIVLDKNSFYNYTKIEIINLNNNDIDVLPDGVFRRLTYLNKLFLKYNKLKYIDASVFEGLVDLEWLFLQNNQLVKLRLPPLPLLQVLQLESNNLRFDRPEDNFPSLPSLWELTLDNNMIEHIREDLFANVSSLHLLGLKNCSIRSIAKGAFDNLTNLRELHLSHNQLHSLPPGLFYRLFNVTVMNLGYNPIQIISEMFAQTNSLISLDLDDLKLDQIDFDALKQLKGLHSVNLYKFRYCSMIPWVIRCTPNSDGVSNLKDLLSIPALRFSAWTIAIITMSLNTLVLLGRGLSRDENRALSLLIRNLAVADMLMGIYLIIIAIQDVRYRDVYHHYSSEWMHSYSCITIGALAMTSSEVSMLILAFMSVERFLLIVNPLGGYARLSLQAARRALILVWCIGFALAILPILYWRNSTGFYGTYSGMCFPLHLREKFPLGWQYSAFIFLGVNLIELLVIASVYCGMFISVSRTRRAAPPLAADCEFAIRFFFIVFTNAVCWTPIICVKILNFLDIEIPSEMYAWLVVFILPLNSAVNPFLYTFTTPKYRDRIVSFSWHYSANRSLNRDTESSRTSSNKNIMCTIVGSIKTTNGDLSKPHQTSSEPLASLNSTYSLDGKL